MAKQNARPVRGAPATETIDCGIAMCPRCLGQEKFAAQRTGAVVFFACSGCKETLTDDEARWILADWTRLLSKLGET